MVMGYKMVPYHAEKYIAIMDFNNMSLTDIPYKYIYEVFSKMDVYYCGNMEKAFVYNIKGIGFAWNLISTFIPEHQKKKIEFIDSDS